ncbi:MAG TPA: hypothetical protein VEA41_00020 [Salinarimonas sp.]|nr:hypothetical protein [Salinarimonas sp.]
MRRDCEGQTAINFDVPPEQAAIASKNDVARLTMVLTRFGMLTAAEICTRMARKPTDNNKRRVRAAARAAFPQILSFSIRRDDGSRLEGYKLLRECTIEEAWAAVNHLASQERDIVHRKKLLLDEIHSGRIGRETITGAQP